MSTDYAYVSDVIYTFNDDVKLMFKTILSSTSANKKHYVNSAEYKISQDKTSNTMIKRTLSYYFYIDDRRSAVRTDRIIISIDDMNDFISLFEYAKMTWFNNLNNGVYGYLDSSLTVMTSDYRMIKLIFDKAIKVEPGVLKHEKGDKPCLNMYVSIGDPIQITTRQIDGLLYLLRNFDVLNYANTTLSYISLKSKTSEKVDFTKKQTIIAEDQSTAGGSVGRSFNGVSKSLLD